MKTLITILRWLVGLLFIFSGLIKANDPLGLSYKMQEFFEAWNWHTLNNYTLFAALVMNVLEVVAGIAIIIGWHKKFFTWLLLLLIIFFTFLTSYVLFSGKIHACGCFGDCVPLTPMQTFTKDIILLLLSLFILFNIKRVTPLFSNKFSSTILVISFLAISFLQWYVLKYLPLKDCLPYAQGKNIIEQMQLPKNATPDLYKMVFIYKKDGKQIEFLDSVPTTVAEDSTYEFVDRKDKLIQKGTGLPNIVDFNLTTIYGNDTTQQVLNTTGNSVFVFAKDFHNVNNWKTDFETIKNLLQQKHIPLFLVTANANDATKYFNGITILLADATAIKTAARVNPTYFLMNEATVIKKISYADRKKLFETIGK